MGRSRSRAAVGLPFAVGISIFAFGALTRLVAVAATPKWLTSPQATPSAGPFRVPVVVLDSQQKPVPDLQPTAFAVRANGAPRDPVSADRTGLGSRTFLIVIDRDTLSGSDGRSAVQVAGSIIDGLPAQDGVELVTLPTVNQRATPTLDRAALRTALSKVTGRMDQVKGAG